MPFKYIFKIAMGIFLLSLAGYALMTQEANTLTIVILGYALGSLPFGYILTRLRMKQDIRSFGSGNIGATNVLRTGNKLMAALTLLFDAAKGGVAIAWLSLYSADPHIPYFIGIAAMVGHIFPLWLDFKGGKGVATALGILLVLSFPLAMAALMTWLIIALLFRYSSLAALVSTGLLPLYSIVAGNYSLTVMSFALAALIFYRHKKNIRLLLAGKESKIGQRVKRA